MASEKSSPPLSLLIVEDDKMALNIIVRMVANEFPHCTIHSAENGIVGLKLYPELNPDLVITDINMPGMGGIEMAREIRSIDVNAGFIVMTAYSDKDLLEKFQEIGFCVYLLKPLNFGELFAAIEKWVKNDLALNLVLLRTAVSPRGPSAKDRQREWS